MRRRPVTHYSRRSARLVGGVALLSLLVSFWLLIRPGERSGVRSIDADGYSRAAIGHYGLVQLLRDRGDPVLQSRQTRDLHDCGLLVLAEPRLDGDDRLEDAIDTALRQVERALLVLPKRYGTRDFERPSWNGDVGLLDLEQAARPLQWLAERRSQPAPELRRSGPVVSWQCARDWPVPTLPGSVQLLQRGGMRMEPLIECRQGVLLARVGHEFVLSDPDLIANHGLLRGDNAALALGIIDELRRRGPIVFDETTHGHVLEPSIWHEIGKFPMVLIPVHLLLLLTLMLWISNGRHGRALPVPPPIGAGKAFLIDNIAALVQRGGRHLPSLRRYARQRVRQAARRLHAPAGLSDDDNLQWLLARMADADRREELEQLVGRTPGTHLHAEALATARRIHELTEENSHVTG